MDDNEFRTISSEALDRLQRSLERASEEAEFDVDRKEGALTVEFENPPGKFVVSPNSPVRQIWISARVKSFKLDWDAPHSTFVYTPTGRSLHGLMADLIAEQTGEYVAL